MKVNPELIKDVRKYGAFDVSKCFNCGNCTAICPLAKEDAPFPRYLIRRAHLGDKKALLTAKGTWLCYYCGECSKTCPREAKPGAFMAAARRYSIANADLTGITKLLYKYPVFNFLFMTAMALFFALFMYANRLEHRLGHKIIEIFHIPYELIHSIGIIIMAIAAVTLLAGMLIIAFRASEIKDVFAVIGELGRKKTPIKAFAEAFRSAFTTVMREMFAFKRFRECDEEKKELPLYRKPWFLHAMTAWGFMGLFSATLLDFAFKDPELLVAIWYPPRLIGTISGLMLMYGASMIIINRLKKSGVSYDNSTYSDWWFIITLWFIGLTGFVLEILVYLPKVDQKTADILFLVHVAPAMQLVVMAAFTKLAHVFYRTHALVVYELISNFKLQISK
ncbi:MAG TPA: 4Fe-4S dicluster domain-containing protein [Candidatus Goldiibacteriota bacterium]|nr:4Fe-4S dicluster domain-containing protein [Candidatus Goldiibacteriota bacterium]